MFLRKRVDRANRWVWATAMSWGVGWGLGLGMRAQLLWVILLYQPSGILPSPLQRMIRTPGAFALFFTAIGVAVGAITGYVLNLLLRHPISAAPEPGQEANTG
jgi:hypothetical protein